MTDTIYGGLSDAILGQMDGFLEMAEGFLATIGNGGAGEPSIGFGSFLGDPNSLPAVLDALTLENVPVTLSDGTVQQFSGNVYVIAAAVAQANGLPLPSVSAITASFAAIATSPLSTIQTQFNNLLSSWVTTGTASEPATGNVLFVLTPAEAEDALNSELSGITQKTEGLATGSLTVTGKSPQTAGASSTTGIRGGYNIGVALENLVNVSNPSWVPQSTISSADAIPNLPPSSAAWQAIVDASFLGIGSGVNTKIGQAVAVSDFSYVWYLLRYTAGGVNLAGVARKLPGYVTRDYAISEMFGLNGLGRQDTIGLQSALEDYETFTEFHSQMVNYEATNSGNIGKANVTYSAGNLRQGARNHGPLATTPPVNPVLTLSQEFAPADAAIVSYLTANTPFMFSTSSFSPYNIYISADASQFEAGVASNPLNAEAAPDITPIDPSSANLLVGPISVLESPTGAGTQAVLTSSKTGNDVLVAAAGNEVLNALAGADTLIGGQGIQVSSPTGGGYTTAGNDTLNGGSGYDVFDFALPSSGSVVETIVPGQNSLVQIEFSSGAAATTLGGSNASQLLPEGPMAQVESWSADGSTSGIQYTFNTLNDTLVISDPAAVSAGGMGGNTIVVDDFNLAAAESFSGFLGIYLKGHVDPPEPPPFYEGASEEFPISVDVPSASAQTFTVTLSGASPSDFEATVGDSIEALSASGTFNVTLPAGETTVSYGLIDTTADNGSSDIAAGATLQLTESVANPDTVAGGIIQSTPLTFSYVPSGSDTAPAPQTDSVVVGDYDSVTGVTTYTGDGADDYIDATGSANLINAQNSGDDSIVGGSGTNTINGSAGNNVILISGTGDQVYLGSGFNTVNGGSGHDTIGSYSGDQLIIGNGGTDLITLGNGTNQIYALTETSLATAIATASSGAPTHAQGDLISVQDGDNTIVGGDGNDFYAAGAGNDVVVMGPGSDTFVGGQQTYDADANRSISMSDGPITENQIGYNLENYQNPFLQPYWGNYEYATGQYFGPANDTVYGGTGNGFIDLGNGSNFVETGSGNDTVYAGMGENTVIAGSGNDFVDGGGGTEYIEGGAGHDTLIGGDGSNTIIGGSGNSTIYSSAGPGGVQFTNASLDQNYVDGGSGNDAYILNAGDGGTAGAATSNDTVYGGSGYDYIALGNGIITLEFSRMIAGRCSEAMTEIVAGSRRSYFQPVPVTLLSRNEPGAKDSQATSTVNALHHSQFSRGRLALPENAYPLTSAPFPPI